MTVALDSFALTEQPECVTWCSDPSHYGRDANTWAANGTACRAVIATTPTHRVTVERWSDGHAVDDPRVSINATGREGADPTATEARALAAALTLAADLIGH